jgi:ribonucleotide reductase alpha subunit
LSEHEKKVFKTWPEINQTCLIRLAAARQRYIDQSQSVSLFFNPDENKKHVHNVHLKAWLSGLKTLYYFRSKKILTVDKLNHNFQNNLASPGISTIPHRMRFAHPLQQVEDLLDRGIDDTSVESNCTFCEG